MYDWIVIHVVPLIFKLVEIVANLLIYAIPFAAGYAVARWRHIEDKQLKVAAWIVTVYTLVWSVITVVLTIKGSYVR